MMVKYLSWEDFHMKKPLLAFLILLNLSLNCFSQEQKNNFIVYPVKGYIFMWSFPNYWINDREFANRIGQAALFYLDGYTIGNSIAHFGIGFGDGTSKMSLDDFAINDINLFIKNMGDDYIAEKVEWSINRQDNVPIIIYKLYSNKRAMYQYCAFMENIMSNYIIAYVQLNTDNTENEKYINDFKGFLQGVQIIEGYLENNN
jgi:hypothetical protein